MARPGGGPPADGRARQRDGGRGLGIPLARTKLLAFALSGFIAGYAGVCLAFATERFSIDTFDPTYSILVVSMVVIGGLGSIDGAVLGAIYLVGLPAMFGTTPTIQFLTSGLGLLAFILYLPGGLAELLHRLGDLVTVGRRAPAGPAATAAPPVDPGPAAPRPAVGDGVAPAGRRRRTASGPARLDVEGVVVDFGGVRAVDGAGLAAEPGSIVGLIGPNGSGKTTMLDVISGLVTPRPGTVRLDGESLVEYLPEERASLGRGAVLPGLPALPRADAWRRCCC